mgnify:CR=1 FL=1
MLKILLISLAIIILYIFIIMGINYLLGWDNIETFPIWITFTVTGVVIYILIGDSLY